MAVAHQRVSQAVTRTFGNHADAKPLKPQPGDEFWYRDDPKTIDVWNGFEWQDDPRSQVAATVGALDFGDPITSEGLESGGSGPIGWSSSIRKHADDHNPVLTFGAQNAGAMVLIDPTTGDPLLTSQGALAAITFPLNASTDNVGVLGTIAHDAVDSGSNAPVKIGGFAVIALPTAVSAGDRTQVPTDLHGRQLMRAGHQAPGVSPHIHAPAANTKATITKSAGSGTQRHACTAIIATIIAGTTAPAAFNGMLNLIDGASGGSTYLAQIAIALPATAGVAWAIALSGLWIPGSQATALTLEFDAAGGANTKESVTMHVSTFNE